MEILLMITRGILLLCVILYIYYFTKRKKENVLIKMWLIILVGLIVGATGRLIDVNLGNLTWNSVQISMVLSVALIGFSVWKLSLELKKERK